MMQIQHVVETSEWGTVDVTEWVDGFELSTRNPGGFWGARLGLRLPVWRARQLQRGWPGGTYTARLMGSVVWQGTLRGLNQGGGQSVLLAQGTGVMALRDTEAWTVFADSGYGGWDPADSDKFDADNNNRVYVQSRDGATYATLDVGYVDYPESGLTLGRSIVRVEADVEVVITSGSWKAELLDDSGGSLFNTTISVSASITATVTSASGLQWRLVYLGAGGGGEASARLTNVVVRTLYPTFVEDVLAAALTAVGVTADTLYPTSLEMDSAIYQGNDRWWRVFEEAVALGEGAGGWLGVIYEQGCVFRDWGDWVGVAWVIGPEHVAGAGVQVDREDVFNAVRPQLPDGWIGSWQTDADSIAKYGRRERTLSLQQMSQAQATALAAVFLADRADPFSAVRLDAGVQVQRADGATWPACFIRAGDVVLVRDVVAWDEDVEIHVAETVFDGRVMRIVPVGAPNRLEEMLVAMEA